MNDLESRLHEAAEETRRVARRAVPPPLLSGRPDRTRGWLVLAAAFAAVLLLFAAPMLIRRGDSQLGNGPDSTLSAPTTTGIAPTTTGPENPVACSATGVPQPDFIDAGLPLDVSAKAHAIVRFSAMCDFDGLAGIAAPDFVTSFGGGGVENLQRWEEEGRGELGTLLKLLGTSHGVIEGEHDPKIYVWPAALVYERWEDIPEEQLEELLAVYTEEELEQIAEYGSYAGWRIGIDEQGNWLYFIAGD
ncbi:MAG: hypothetical protein ACRDVL_10765 [Acidimicrobiia bacterium]